MPQTYIRCERQQFQCGETIRCTVYVDARNKVHHFTSLRVGLLQTERTALRERGARSLSGRKSLMEEKVTLVSSVAVGHFPQGIIPRNTMIEATATFCVPADVPNSVEFESGMGKAEIIYHVAAEFGSANNPPVRLALVPVTLFSPLPSVSPHPVSLLMDDPVGCCNVFESRSVKVVGKLSADWVSSGDWLNLDLLLENKGRTVRTDLCVRLVRCVRWRAEGRVHQETEVVFSKKVPVVLKKKRAVARLLDVLSLPLPFSVFPPERRKDRKGNGGRGPHSSRRRQRGTQRFIFRAQLPQGMAGSHRSSLSESSYELVSYLEGVSGSSLRFPVSILSRPIGTTQTVPMPTRPPESAGA
eukprot:Cvel_18382.t1-p1 / transcript=Cvel_18382.t1 / gene=Cvel_18382 / organism=Chromera_velia_CCMP2878 / gene_product=hypothetical protein / transcript_product=hypothetical protein / location=Cvel_scaffold1519:41240-45035(+) / protein_length=356 / sequence_SO=supercontig / SO=protein_coding / is_pseudo=false